MEKTTHNIEIHDVRFMHSSERDCRSHRFSVPWQITEDKAKQLQSDLGYHHNGYGFYSFVVFETGHNRLHKA